jgi:hypothetical protein
VAVEALRPFGCLSRPDLHTIEDANGDVTSRGYSSTSILAIRPSRKV